MQFSHGVKALLLVLILALGSPVLAQDLLDAAIQESAPVVDLGVYHVMSNTWSPGADKGGGVPIWATSEASGLFLPVANTTRERINSGDLPVGTVISRFTVGFTTDSSIPVSADIAFYNTDLFDTQTAILQRADGTDAVYSLTFDEVAGMPGVPVPYNVTIDLSGGAEVVITGPDVDGDGLTDWGWGSTYTDFGDSSPFGCSGFPCIGPRLSGITTPPGATGSQNRWDAYDPAAWLGGPYVETLEFPTEMPPGTNFMIIEGTVPSTLDIPTLSSAGLAALMVCLSFLGIGLLRKRSGV